MREHGPVVAYCMDETRVLFYALATTSAGRHRGSLQWRCVEIAYMPRSPSDRPVKGLLNLVVPPTSVSDDMLLNLRRRKLLRDQPDAVLEAITARVMAWDE